MELKQALEILDGCVKYSGDKMALAVVRDALSALVPSAEERGVWQKPFVKKIIDATGITGEQAMTIMALVCDEREHAYVQGSSNGFNGGYEYAKNKHQSSASSVGTLDLDPAIAQMDKCVKCLALELHEAVHGDVEETWFRLKTAIRLSRLAPAPVEGVKDGIFEMYQHLFDTMYRNKPAKISIDLWMSFSKCVSEYVSRLSAPAQEKHGDWVGILPQSCLICGLPPISCHCPVGKPEEKDDDDDDVGHEQGDVCNSTGKHVK